MKSLLIITLLLTSLLAQAQNTEESLVCEGKDLSISLQDIPFIYQDNFLPGLKINCNTHGKIVYELASKLSIGDGRYDSKDTEGLLTIIKDLIRSAMRVDNSQKHLNQKLALLLAAKTNGWKVKMSYKKSSDLVIKDGLLLTSLEIL
jgi:hypothetical protein